MNGISAHVSMIRAIIWDKGNYHTVEMMGPFPYFWMFGLRQEVLQLRGADFGQGLKWVIFHSM
jgi:hypothetical protein